MALSYLRRISDAPLIILVALSRHPVRSLTMNDAPVPRLCPLHGWYANDAGECAWCVLDAADAEFEFVVNDMTVPGHCAICGDSPVRLADCDSGNFTVHCAQCGQCTHCYGDLPACYRLPPVLTETEREAEGRRSIEMYRYIETRLKAILSAPSTSQRNRDEATRMLETVRGKLPEKDTDADER